MKVIFFIDKEMLVRFVFVKLSELYAKARSPEYFKVHHRYGNEAKIVFDGEFNLFSRM